MSRSCLVPINRSTTRSSICAASMNGCAVSRQSLELRSQGVLSYRRCKQSIVTGGMRKSQGRAVARKRQEKTNTEDTEEEAQRTQRRVEEFKVEELKWTRRQNAETSRQPTGSCQRVAR